MDMVGHDDITANRYAARFRLFRILTEFLMNSGVSKKRFPVGGAEGDEINGRIVGLEDLGKAVGFVGVGGHAGSMEIAMVRIKRFPSLHSGEALLHIYALHITHYALPVV